MLSSFWSVLLSTSTSRSSRAVTKSPMHSNTKWNLYVITSFMVAVVSRMFGARFVKRTLSHFYLKTCRVVSDMLYDSVRIWPLRDAKVSSSATCSPSGQSNGWKQSCMQMNPRCRQRRFGFSRTDESGNRGDDSFREERETGWSLGIRAQGTVVYIQFASEGEPDYHRLHQQVFNVLTNWT